MGFYHPATLVKDAERHGLRFLPIDVTRSDWPCGIEAGAVRLGLRYVRGLREGAARAIVSARGERPFASIADLARRAGLARDELATLAAIGALAPLGGARRAAVGPLAPPPPGPLLAAAHGAPDARASPLPEMTEAERLLARHPGGGPAPRPPPPGVRVAGSVIVRQRPGTAKGFVFLSLEDETGIANVIVTPGLFARARATLVDEPFLCVASVGLRPPRSPGPPAGSTVSPRSIISL